MLVNYTALREFAPTHVENGAYSFTVGTVADNRRRPTEGRQSVAIDGTTVSVIHRGDEIRQVVTVAVETGAGTPDLEDLREFLESVKYGETFQLDGVDHVMDNFRNPYQETRIPPKWYRFSFSARKLPT